MRLRWPVWLVLPFVLAMSAPALWAGPEAGKLARVLRVGDLALALHEEGLVHGRSLEREMLSGRGGTHWMDEVARIYATERIAGAIRQALSDRLASEHAAASLTFFDTPLGQEILALEVAARISMRDPQIEEMARAAYDDRKRGEDARLQQIARFVVVNDLVERNVAGAMSASYQFFRGLADGDAIDLGEAEILAEVWAEEQETRTETESWLFGYLLMAYQPLSYAELERYIAFSKSPAGGALNAALFEGFDVLYRQVSYELGLRIAAALKASDI